MINPSYIALRFFWLHVRQNPQDVMVNPSEFYINRVMKIQDRFGFDALQSREFIGKIAIDLAHPERFTESETFESALVRFPEILMRGLTWNMDVLQSNLGKVGQDLGREAPFHFNPVA